MAKIAVESRDVRTGIGEPVSNASVGRQLAKGDGWSAVEFVCHAGPRDRPFEEQHTDTSIAIVLGGTFQYRTTTGDELMTPGSLLLGNAGECFSCGHEHGTGDHCLSFSYAPGFFERLASDAAGAGNRFGVPRLPPIRELAPLASKGSALLARRESMSFEELAVQVAARAVQVARGVEPRRTSSDPSSVARVTRVVRMIENEPEIQEDLDSLARIARLSPYHFLRSFEGLTGTTPHQYVLRIRLRRAAVQLKTGTAKISDIAFGCGFGDISNFNRSFRAEFGMAPRRFRLAG